MRCRAHAKKVDANGPNRSNGKVVQLPKGTPVLSSIQNICVYCGSQPGNDTVYLKAARALGEAMGKAGMALVYGGGAKGIMGAVADSVLASGGKVTGIIPQFLIAKESSAQSLTRLSETLVTENMHERKHLMFERSDAFVALPGGIGTLEEIIEIMTWAQLGRHEKPIVFANIGGFWDPLLALLDHMRSEGFIHTQSRVRPLVIDRAEDIVPALRARHPHDGRAEGAAAVIDRL
jgi:uncharacterized protein (TIGR00730 family)